MISRINDYFKKNEKNIKKWIIFKSISNGNINYKECKFSGKISLYGISNKLDKKDELSLLYDSYYNSTYNDKMLVDYFWGTNKRNYFKIYKDIKTNEYYFPKFNNLKFKGLYDFDSMSNTLIVYDSEAKKLVFYLNTNPPSSKTLENKFSDTIKVLYFL